MDILFDRLNKFLQLEIEKGYKNIAVIGGLDKIVPWWEKEAIDKHLDPSLIKETINRLNEYPRQEVGEREASIKEILKLLKISNLDFPDINDHSQAHSHAPSQSVGSNPPTADDLSNKPHLKDHPAANISKNVQENRGRNPAYPTVSGLDAPLTTLNNIGPHRAKSLSLLGLNTLYNLLYYFPRRYDDYSKLKPINRIEYNEILTIIGTIHSIQARTIKSGRVKQYTEALITDGTGFLRVLWFNQVWIAQRLHPGDAIVVSGKIEQNLGRPIMKSPDWEPLEKEHLHTNRIVPVYALTSEVTQKILRGITHDTVSYFAPRIIDFLPEKVRSSTGLVSLAQAIYQIHWPENMSKLDAARSRLCLLYTSPSPRD